MSFVHNLYIGKFKHEGDHVKIERSAFYRVKMPVIQSPLAPKDFVMLLPEGQFDAGSPFPPEWHMEFLEGMIICDKHKIPNSAREFIAKIVGKSDCEIYDYNSGITININDIPPPLPCVPEKGA